MSDDIPYRRNDEPMEPRRFTRLQCSACGATADAACNCNAPYLPAGVRAAAAVAAGPEKSDRVIAKEIGVSPATVSRARESVASNDAPGNEARKAGSGNPEPEKRVGKDGKSYPATKPKKAKAEPEPERPPKRRITITVAGKKGGKLFAKFIWWMQYLEEIGIDSEIFTDEVIVGKFLLANVKEDKLGRLLVPENVVRSSSIAEKLGLTQEEFDEALGDLSCRCIEYHTDKYIALGPHQGEKWKQKEKHPDWFERSEGDPPGFYELTIREPEPDHDDD